MMNHHFLSNYLQSPWKEKKLKGDSGERNYSRIQSSKGSFILVTHPDTNKNFEDFISVQGFLNNNSLPAPKILQVDKLNKLLLLEDLGKIDLEQYYLTHKNLSFHFKALDVLYDFQTHLSSVKFKKKFNVAQGFNEMLLSYQNLQYHLNNKEKEPLLKEFQKICTKLCQQPFVPSHRDFHSRNLLIHEGQIYMIDFQDAGLYPQYYDCVSLIHDSYTTLTHQDKVSLMEYYSEKWKTPICIESFTLTSIQRTFKAIGSFMSFYHLRRQTQHLKYVKPCLLDLENQLSILKTYPHFLKYIQTLLNSK